MNKKALLIIASLVALILLIGLGSVILEKKSQKREVERTLSIIKSNYIGVVVDKYSPYGADLEPTFMKIRTLEGLLIKMAPQDKVIDKVKIGDTIIKPMNENIVYIVDKNNDRTEHFYVRISKKKRLHKNFPIEWKKKWMESSRYDSINR